MSLTVEFTGICTHVTSPTEHRVVLVHAEDGAFINGAKIPPHIPTLRIDPSDIIGIDGWPSGLEPTTRDGVWRLCGVQLEITGAIDAVVVRDRDFAEVPKLSALTPDSPTPAETVVQQGVAACYFDIRGGRLSAKKNKYGAVSTVLRVKTSDTPGLRVFCFWNQEARLISLRNGATIHIEHTGSRQGDTDRDFLLHYRVLKSIPPDAHVPPNTKKRRPDAIDISSGCSNSQYP